MPTAINDSKYEALNSWYASNEDDHIIADFLRKKMIKESHSLIIFYVFLLITFLMTLLYTSMIMENFIASIVTFLFCILASSLLYSTLVYVAKRKKQIDNRGFNTCLIDAYEISDTYNDKYCLIMDKEKHSLSTPFSYHSYFSHKETDGVLVVLPGLEKKKPDFSIVIPRSFIICAKE